MHYANLLSIFTLCGAALSSRVRRQPFHFEHNSTTHSNVTSNTTTFRSVGFYANYDIYARNFNISDILAHQFTHITYSNAAVNNVTGETLLSDSWADVQKPFPGDENTSANATTLLGNLKQLYLLKKRHRSIKTLLSVGGFGGSPNISAIIGNETCRATLATSAVKMMYDLGFDGLDYDYEFINSTLQATQFTDLLVQTRSQMSHYTTNSSQPFLLTMDLPAGPQNYVFLADEVQNFAKYVDFFNFMAFDYAGGWLNTATTPPGYYAGHAQNLYGSNNTLVTPFNSTSGIDWFISKGIKASNLNLGLPLYGHAFLNTDGPGTMLNGTGIGSYGSIGGTWDYNMLPINGSLVNVTEIMELGASYSYDAYMRTMVSYDTPTIARTKAQYVRDRGLGGVMWWEVSGDKRSDESLVQAGVDVMALDTSAVNRLDYPDSVYQNLAAGFPREGQKGGY